jgi:hypothetical protein
MGLLAAGSDPTEERISMKSKRVSGPQGSTHSKSQVAKQQETPAS